MNELVEFLTARLDEEACVAEAAQARHPSPWRDEHEHELGPGHVYDNQGGEVFDNSGGHLGSSHPGAVHIAYWDPARVLAEIEAKREILAIHGPFHAYGDEEEKYPLCSRCEDGVQRMVAFPCETTLALVQPHADHPDYRQGWGTG